ncbi:MAG: V-type ATP synthase subunit F [Halobacteria archaeon]|nr:V-type ATP synthase subunit F [Halobacteria archaeon]
MRVGVIGSPSFTTGFRLAGVDDYHEIDDGAGNGDAVEVGEEYDEAVRDFLEDDDIGIIVMHQDDLEHLSRDVREDVEESIEPTLVTLGGDGGGGALREKIKRAIGIDLME